MNKIRLLVLGPKRELGPGSILRGFWSREGKSYGLFPKTPGEGRFGSQILIPWESQIGQGPTITNSVQFLKQKKDQARRQGPLIDLRSSAAVPDGNNPPRTAAVFGSNDSSPDQAPIYNSTDGFPVLS